MKLTPEERELLREKLILECHDSGRKGVKVSTLINKAAAAGYENLTGAELDAELRYLEGARLIEEVSKEISPEVRRYVSTKGGYDFLAEKGLV
jgi:hypothetical protein